MITVTKIIEFDAGHRLLNHEGACAHYHGHHYVAEITVSANDLDSVGRVIDFSVIKNNVGTWVNTYWDHNMLLHVDDPLYKTICKLTPEKIPFLFFGNPTAENIAQNLCERACGLLPDEITIVKVRIWETPTCYADYTP